jgi:Uma2 family endonuclease
MTAPQRRRAHRAIGSPLAEENGKINSKLKTQNLKHLNMAAMNPNPMVLPDDSLRSPQPTLPTMYDLPSEFPEESGLPDVFHDLQPQLLSRTLRLSGYGSDRLFTASDLNIYYDLNHPLWHRRPDWFLALDVPRLYDGWDLRRSYVVWQEGKSPHVVMEFIFPGTEVADLGRFATAADSTGEEPDPVFTEAPGTPSKLEVYERYLQVPNYLVYNRYTQKLRHFQLLNGRYQEQSLSDTNPMVWLADLGIGVGLWEGTFENTTSRWLRWCDRGGNWFLTDTEQERRAREQERRARERAEQVARQARSAKEQAEAQLLQAAENLLATGMTLDQVSQILNLTDEQQQWLKT